MKRDADIGQVLRLIAEPDALQAVETASNQTGPRQHDKRKGDLRADH